MNYDDVRRFVTEGRIVWTMTTIGYTKYTLNLSRWLTTIAKVPWTLCIVCCDKESEAFFRRERVPYISWNGDKVRRTQDGMAAFGTPSFEKCNHQKLSILEWFCRNYSECGIEYSLYLDGDIVVRVDPWPLILPEFTDVDMLFQCDCFNTLNHGPDLNCNNICSGVIATRHIQAQAQTHTEIQGETETKGETEIQEQGEIQEQEQEQAKAEIQEKGEIQTKGEIQANLYVWEPILWESVSKQDQPFIASRLVTTKTPYKILERRLFGNGAWMKAGTWKTEEWCLLHYNYLVSGSKRTALKENGHWIIEYQS